MKKGSKLYFRLEQLGCKDFYWHCHKRKKLPAIDLPKKEFLRSLWPGQGLTYLTAVDIDIKATKLHKAGSVEVECGEYLVTAYWRTK